MSCGQCTRWHRRESRLDTSSGHMKRNGSMTRKHNIHKLKYIIHMSTKSYPRHALTRAFCVMWPRGYEVLSPTGADSRTLRYDTHRALQRGSRPTSSQTETSSLANANPAKFHSCHAAAERSLRRISEIICATSRRDLRAPIRKHHH